MIANIVTLYDIEPNLAKAELSKLTARQINQLITKLRKEPRKFAGLLDLLLSL